MLKRLLICSAFAIWCFLDCWVEYAEGSVVYFARYAPFPAVVAPILVLELLITVGLFALWELKGKSRSPTGLHYAFLCACCVPFGILSIALPRLIRVDLAALVRHRGFWPVAVIAGLAPLGLMLLRPREVSRFVRGVLLYSWPALLLLQVQAVRTSQLASPAERFADGPLAQRLPQQSNRTRVVWIVFDELSQALTFGDRPSNLKLPEFDRLKGESFYAADAISPSQMTRQSLPALILGELVAGTRPVGPEEFLFEVPKHSEWTSLRTASNVFDSARRLGLNTAVVGWYHPYGRLLNHSLTKCYWTASRLPPGVEERWIPQSFTSALWDRLKLQLAALPLAGRVMSPLADHRKEKTAQFMWLRARALELASDASLGLVLIHLPVPHPPSISKQGVVSNPANTGYLDSLMLADRTLGDLRRAMETAGQWDSSAVLVSSDHSWRPELWRGDSEWTDADEAASVHNTPNVPFLVKLPGQTLPMTYSKPFNTVVTREVITGVLGGQIDSPEAIAEAIATQN